MIGSVIVAFSFGKPSDISSNEMTAYWAKEFSYNRGWHPIVLDRSVPLNEKNFKGDLFYVGGEASKHNSTLELVKEFVELAIKKKWNHVVVVGCPDYTSRVVRDINKIFERKNHPGRAYKANVSRSCDKPKDWYDSRSTQLWTKYRFLFRAYEWILMTMPFDWYEWLTAR